MDEAEHTTTGEARRTTRWTGIIVALLFVILTSAVFLVFPGIDLWFSRFFYDPGHSFALAKNPALRIFRRSGDILVVATVVWLIVSITLGVVRSRTGFATPRIALFLLATLAVGPGLLVNAALKDHWGRPRPASVEAFGGPDPYIAVWRISEACDRNCSFVAGEASSAVWLFVVALFAPRQVRAPLGIATGVYAVLLSLNRIAFGGHFLSDVLLAWGLTFLIAAILYRVMVQRLAPAESGA